MKMPKFLPVILFVLSVTFLAEIPGSASADTTIPFRGGFSITIPDGVSYAAWSKGRITRSENSIQRSLSNEMFLEGQTLEEGGNALISIHMHLENFESVPNPKRASFSLEEFGKAMEKIATRGMDGARIARLDLTKIVLQGEIAIIDHQFDIMIDSKPEESLRYHYVVMVLPNRTPVLEIRYPLALEQKWGAATKSIAASFRPAP